MIEMNPTNRLPTEKTKVPKMFGKYSVLNIRKLRKLSDNIESLCEALIIKE